MFVPVAGLGRSPAGRRSANSARWLELHGRHARGVEHIHVGTGWLALRLPRRLLSVLMLASPARRPKNGNGWTPACGVIIPRGTFLKSFTEGGSNPWGIDFDEYGQLWAEMCVIPHLWHMIQGARLERQGGEHFAFGPDETSRYAQGQRQAGSSPHLRRHQNSTAITSIGRASWAARGQRAQRFRGRRPRPRGRDVLSGRIWPAEYRGKLYHRQYPRPAR